MSSLSFQSRASARAEALSAGRYDRLVEEYAYPLTVFLDGAPRVLHRPGEAWAFFQTFHAALVSCGLARIEARVVAEDLPRGGRCRFWTDWYAEGPGIAPRRIASTVCYCRVDGTDCRTEMMEFTRLDLPMPVAA